MPSLKHARVWGCPCYAYVPKGKRVKSPMKETAQKCIYLGRGETSDTVTDGYLVLDSKGEILSTSVVSFDEQWELEHATGSAEAKARDCRSCGSFILGLLTRCAYSSSREAVTFLMY